MDKYDTKKKYTATTEEDKYRVLQWVFFQASGQGYVHCLRFLLTCAFVFSCRITSPYYGQAVWFQLYHPEKIASAVERYQNEIKRVLGVLESVLSKQEWLVAGKLTIADISFVSYVSCRAFFASDHGHANALIVGVDGTTYTGSSLVLTSTSRKSSLLRISTFVYLKLLIFTLNARFLSHAARWHKKLTEVPGIKAALAEQASLKDH